MQVLVVRPFNVACFPKSLMELCLGSRIHNANARNETEFHADETRIRLVNVAGLASEMRLLHVACRVL
jgi:hypothetical protein